MPEDLQAIAKDFNIYNSKNSWQGQDFDRVILLSTEAMSAKFLNHYNLFKNQICKIL